MSKQPLVSVVIIFLNAEEFLREAIESVFCQTYAEWELLLVDDGSMDRSTEISLEYTEQYPRKVRYLEHAGHQNRGMPASRNLGILNASGKYVAFLDADDVWLPHKLEQQVAILETQPEAAMVYGLSKWWYSWTGRPEDSQRDFVHRLGVPSNTLIQPPYLFLSFFFRQDAAIPSPTDILVRRKILEEIGGCVESFNGINNVYEDQALYAKITLNAPVIGVDTCWDLYRQHPGSSVAVVKNSRQEIKTRLFFLSWLSSYLSAQEIKDPKILIALRKELWKLRHPKAWQLWHKIQQSIWKLKSLPFWLAERILPAPLYHWLKARWRGEEYIPPTGRVRFGNFRRLSPFSRTFGYNRGQPIDRYYIEQFLALHQMDVRGRVLEIADRGYTCQFGGDRVTKSEILHVTPGDPKATIIGDLASADHIPSDSFDCIILTQTLQFIFDIRMALQTIYRILKPGGVILATFPGITAISRYDMDRWGQFWGFSSLSARRLFEQVFAQETLEIKTCGNILTASAFLYGMAAEELREDELEYFDPDYEVIIAVRATKPKPEEQTQI